MAEQVIGTDVSGPHLLFSPSTLVKPIKSHNFQARTMVSLKQELEPYDYFGFVVVFALYMAVVFIICVTCIMWCCIEEGDDVTVLHKVRVVLGLSG